MQSAAQINSNDEKGIKNLFRNHKIFSLCFFALTIYHMSSWQVLAAEEPTDQSQGVLADILNSERITPEPTEPLTEPLLEIVTELPDSELMIPFFELIYAVTPSEGEMLKEVYVNVNGEYDRHLYQRAMGEPKVTERKFGEARLFISENQQKSRFELVAVDSSNKRTYYPIEQSFWLSENPEPPSPTIADVTTEEYFDEEVTFINNRIQFQLDRKRFNQEFGSNHETVLDKLLYELSYFGGELLSGPDKNDFATIRLKGTSYEELERIIQKSISESYGFIADGKIQEIDLATSDLLPSEEEPVNRSFELKPEMVRVGFVPGLFLRRYQNNVLSFQLHEETSFLNAETFPETYLSKKLIENKIDETITAIDGIRLERNPSSYSLFRVKVADGTPRELIKKAQKLLAEHPNIFAEARLAILADIKTPRYATIPEYERKPLDRRLNHLEQQIYQFWGRINENGTVSSMADMGLRGLPTIVKLLGGAGLFCGILSFAIFIYRKRPPRKKHEFWG